MIVYVESNFILEIALQQEEAAEAEQILLFGEQKAVRLCIPAFSLSEPFDTLRRRGIERRELANRVAQQVVQLRRSPTHARDVRRLEHVPKALMDVVGTQADRLERTVETILAAGELIRLDTLVYDEAIRSRLRYGFGTTQDAIIYASVLTHLWSQEPAAEKCFVTRNPRDFERDPRIRDELQKLNCRLIGTFTAALDFVRRRVGGVP